MTMRRAGLSGLLFVLIASAGCAPPAGPESAAGFPLLTGEYLGQKPPGATAELFAPGIVGTGMYTRDVAITPDGTEIYYGLMLGRFRV